ncbi:hypothetical protein CR513_12717, partial [Mucuna pruriens]
MLLLQEFDIEIRDKKGVENFVADHLSRIEKESEPMPIIDEFLDEHLLHITMPTPWFANIYNFVATSQFPLEASRDFAVIKLFANASLKLGSIWSSNSTMQHLEEDTMDQLRLLEKCLIVAFIGPLFSKTLISSSPPTTNTKKLEWQLPKGMKCPNNPSCSVKFFICGAIPNLQ